MPRVFKENILSLLSEQLRHIFDDLYQACIIVRDKLVSSTVEKTSVILWDTLQSHEVMAEFSKHDIKRHPSITVIFVCFLITAKILEPLQDISQINRDIKVLGTKSERHRGRLDKLKERGKPEDGYW